VKLRHLIVLLGLWVATAAQALTAIEFLRMETDGKEADVCKQLVFDFVSQGYRNVPDWSKLSVAMRKKILEKGYTTMSVEQVALEAALETGMRR